MRTSVKQAVKPLPAIGKVSTALAIALAMGAMSIAPAFAQHDEKRGGAEQSRAQSNDRNRNDHRKEPVRRLQYQHPYRYSQPVYAPRAAYYYQDQRPVISIQSPGISLFFPLDLR